MESNMNSLSWRIVLMAALLSLFNMVSASDGLLDIEVGSSQPIEEEHSSTEMGEHLEMAVEHGDILGVEILEPSTNQPMPMERELIDLRLPARGMDKSKVRSDFGEPIQMRPAVGKPPISSWLYEDYTVYFEHEWVLHSVLNKK